MHDASLATKIRGRRIAKDDTAVTCQKGGLQIYASQKEAQSRKA